MASSKRLRQRMQRLANDYAPANNPYSAPSSAPATGQPEPLATNPTAPQGAELGMADDQGDGTPPVDTMMDPSAGRNGQAMAARVALHCFGCGAEDWVGLDKVARIGEGGKQLTCTLCRSTDLDVLDRDPQMGPRQRVAMAAKQANRVWSETVEQFQTYPGLVEEKLVYTTSMGDYDLYVVNGLGGWMWGVSGAATGSEVASGSASSRAAAQTAAEAAVPSEVAGQMSMFARLQARVAKLIVAKTQKCDVCGHTVRSAPDEQGWECPKCHEGTMQDAPDREAKTAAEAKTCEQCKAAPAEGYAMGPKSGDWGGNYCAACAAKLGWPLEPYKTSAKRAFSEPLMDHLHEPSAAEIMAKAEAIPLPIKRLPPKQQVDATQVVEAVMATNPGLSLAQAWRLAHKTVAGRADMDYVVRNTGDSFEILAGPFDNMTEEAELAAALAANPGAEQVSAEMLGSSVPQVDRR